MAEPGPRLRLTEDGVVELTLPLRLARAQPGAVGIRLDGIFAATAELVLPRRGLARAAWPLPRHVLASTVELLSLATGDPFAPPLDLREACRLAAEIDAMRHAAVSGWISAPAWFDRFLGVELMEGETLRGRGIAERPQPEIAEDGTILPARHRFTARLDSLVALNASRTLRLRVGGRLLAAPLLMLGPRDVGIAGFLDEVTRDRVEGWAVDLEDPSRRVRLDLLIDGAVMQSFDADRLRPDISGAGFGDGHCGFVATLPRPADPFVPRQVSVRLAATPTHLCNSPVEIPPEHPVIGCFDRLHGMSAHGWAMNRADPATPVSVEVVGPGGVITTARAAEFRGDLLEAGMGEGMHAFRIDLTPWIEQLMDRDVTLRVAGTGEVLPGSPKRLAANPNIARFLRRRQAVRPAALARLRRHMAHATRGEGVSLVMPVYNTKRQWLAEALESVRTQWCDAWELIVVDDASTEPHVAEVLDVFARADARIRVLRSPANVGIARAVNFGLRAVRHGLVAFMDHDDYLEPDAVWQLLRAARQSGADLLYSDEVLTGDSLLNLIEFRMRPAFSHDYYLSHPYFVHLVAVRTDLARRIGGYDETLPISADVDFVLRAIEHAEAVAHIPAILYRWRTHESSTGHAKQDHVTETTVACLQRHLDRLRTGARARPGCWFNQYHVDWPAQEGRTLVVIPTKNKVGLLRAAIESLERTTDMEAVRVVVIDHQSDDAETIAYLRDLDGRHFVLPYAGEFNYSRMNNQAVAAHGEGCRFVLFLNNDVEAIEPGWLDRLKSLAGRPEIGAVGPMLLYADRRIQHAGVILGFNDSAEHALKFEPYALDTKGRRNLGYNCALSSVRDYSAVTAACMLMRRDVFEAVGGFDEAFGVGFNDTDLCLRVRDRGWRILYDGATALMHYESATRSETRQVLHPSDTRRLVDRWSALLRSGDPFYHPNLSMLTRDHVPREDEACRILHPPRIVRPGFAAPAFSAAAE